MNDLRIGNAIAVIIDLKVKASSSVVMTKALVKNIRLVKGDHDIDRK